MTGTRGFGWAKVDGLAGIRRRRRNCSTKADREAGMVGSRSWRRKRSTKADREAGMVGSRSRRRKRSTKTDREAGMVAAAAAFLAKLDEDRQGGNRRSTKTCWRGDGWCCG
jgi:hypothetical protein